MSNIAGPAIGAILIGTGHAAVWVVATVGGATVSAVRFRGLRGHLSEAQDGVGRDLVPAAH